MNRDIRNNIDNFAGSCDNQVKILIVEDSPTQAEKMAFILERQDYGVFIAQNGAEALGLIKSHKPTLIISDILMPEMNGYQLCQAIKENEDFKEIPVILLTSLTDPKDVVKVLECGADNFIAKPYDERYLLSRIQNLLADTHLRETERTQLGMEITLGSEKYFIKSDRIQILNLLFSSYEAAVQKNNELEQTRMDLAKAKDRLEETVVSLAIVNQELHVLNRELDSRRNEAEEARFRADGNTKAKSGFLADMGHELRTPLTSIIGFSEILEDEMFGNLNLKQKEYVMKILSSGKTLLLLINNLTGETKNAEENSLGRG